MFVPCMNLAVWTYSSHESPVAQWYSIRTGNRKVFGSTPDRSARISVFPSLSVSLTEYYIILIICFVVQVCAEEASTQI